MNELLLNVVDLLYQWLFGFGDIGVLIWIILKILVIIVLVIILVVFYVVWECKLIGWMYVCYGLMYVGMGIFQVFVDVFKLLFKEVVQLSSVNKVIYLLVLLIILVLVFVVWLVVFFDLQIVLFNVNVGLLYLLVMILLGIYGIILVGWVFNLKYVFLGVMCVLVQMISYEIVMGFVLVGVMIVLGSLNLSNIVVVQVGSFGFFDWFLLLLFLLFVIYWVLGVVEINCVLFDVVEGELEIVVGYMVEYFGGVFVLFFLVEYVNMILISFLILIFFFGGWFSLVQGWVDFGNVLLLVDWIWKGGVLWLFVKVFFFVSVYIWFCVSFLCFCYDQIMCLGWKVFILLVILWIVVIVVMVFFGVI